MGRVISFRCRGCNARIRAPHQLRGQERACPGCGHRLVIQPAPLQDEGPVLVPEAQPPARPGPYNRS